MAITVGKMIENLQKLDKDLPMYAVVGSSGVSYEMSYPYHKTMGENNREDGDLLELKPGDRYCWVYIGG